MSEHRPQTSTEPAAPLLILGASGTLGRALAAECRQRDITHILLSRAELDLAREGDVDRAIDRYRPWAVANAAGWVRVDEAEDNEVACRAANAAGAIAVAQACRSNSLPSLNFSTDLVFDGATDAPYSEHDTPRPLNAYGRSKLEMEERVAGLAGQHLVVRTAAFFSPHDPYNFAHHCVAAARRGEAIHAVEDCAVSPTYVPDLCRAALDLLIDRETGVWHLTNGEAVSWLEFAHRLLAAVGADPAGILPTTADRAGWRAPRPSYSALASTRGQSMPGLDCAISGFAASHLPATA